ncbi:MAG: serine/threonine-protein kinase, partial [Chloroflexota bacterium]
MTNLTGKVIEERYTIEKKIGEGGMAIVYKAHDARLDREVAIKFIRRDSVSNDRYEIFLLRFNQEAKTLAKIAHPNIINVFDFGSHEGSPYFVMEYLPGGTLKNYIGKPVPWQKTLELVLPVARALDYAHQQGVVHRDVKPANMLLTKGGELKLSDFGIAKILAAEENSAVTLTSSGGIGTPEYMAPEQWKNEISSQTDIYALGVVLYELITGRKPYIANTPAEILIKQVNDPFLKIKIFVPNIPDEVDWLITKAMAKDPRQRF